MNEHDISHFLSLSFPLAPWSEKVNLFFDYSIIHSICSSFNFWRKEWLLCLKNLELFYCDGLEFLFLSLSDRCLFQKILKKWSNSRKFVLTSFHIFRCFRLLWGFPLSYRKLFFCSRKTIQFFPTEWNLNVNTRISYRYSWVLLISYRKFNISILFFFPLSFYACFYKFYVSFCVSLI